ncbi:DUF2975 domain-containing protein [Chromobacterium vaccinii]|uniref:DUF2975 domain-containing protein n=2 Tax=Chromobacterium vaccinii TaxID=1108595 RepID=UPI001E59AFF4|nr:DUF2975 domain-containing protein [Chromobacterium vaccinii]MCD4500779.1 DUF2975 domain-containing protein [Chromobacterium vaccinii]
MNSPRLSRYCAVMACVTFLGICAMLLFHLLLWLFPKAILDAGLTISFDDHNGFYGLRHFDMTVLPLWQRLGGAVISCLPLLVLAQGLNALRRLFRLYAQAEYFSEHAASLLAKVGSRIAFWVLADILVQPLMGVWLTMMQPAGHRQLTFGLDTGNLESLFIAAVVMVIARIQQEGVALARENKQFL